MYVARPNVIHLCLCVHLKNYIVILFIFTSLNAVICVCSANDINDGFVTSLCKVSFLFSPVECVLQARS